RDDEVLVADRLMQIEHLVRLVGLRQTGVTARDDETRCIETFPECVRRQIAQARGLDTRVADAAESFEDRREALLCFFPQRIQLTRNARRRHDSSPVLFVCRRRCRNTARGASAAAASPAATRCCNMHGDATSTSTGRPWNTASFFRTTKSAPIPVR